MDSAVKAALTRRERMICDLASAEGPIAAE